MQTIAEKIKKILEKAAATDQAGEAAVLMEAAQRMMEKHQLEAWEIETAGDPIGSTMTDFYQNGPSSYKPMIRRALAGYYGCEVVRIHKTQFDAKYKNGYLQGYVDDLMGPESARVTTELMTDYVWKQIGREAAKLEKAGHGKRGALVRQIANALNARIWTLKTDHEKEAATVGTTTANALVAIGNAVVTFRDDKYPKLSAGRSSQRSAGAAARGAAAGISLNRQATGSKTLALR